jgi:hypothetical protein
MQLIKQHSKKKKHRRRGREHIKVNKKTKNWNSGSHGGEDEDDSFPGYDHPGDGGSKRPWNVGLVIRVYTAQKTSFLSTSTA